MSREEERETRPVETRARAVLVVIIALLTIGFGGLATRLYWVQIVRHEHFAAIGRRMWRGKDPVFSTRGDIRTRDDVIVARSVLSYEIGIDPIRIEEPDLVELVRVVARVLELPAETRREAIRRVLESRREEKRYVRIARNVEAEAKDRMVAAVAAAFPDEVLEALIRLPGSKRVYPRGDLLGPVLGATDVDGRGMEGLELWGERYLAHLPGTREVRKDATQTLRFYFPENSGVSSVNGWDLELTIDSRVQRILEEELAAGAERYRVASGLGVVMDCRSGDILAMASWPGYDPNEYHRYPREERELRRRNRPIENTYEPGSVLKPFVAAWAFKYGLTRRDEVIWGGGSTYAFEGRRRVTDAHDRGPLTSEAAIYHSSNIGLATLGLRLGKGRLNEMLDAFGLCRPTGITLPGEAPGAKREMRDWSELYTSVSVSFGYAVRVSPIQLVTAFTALVNGGTLYRPRLIRRATRGNEEIANPTEVIGYPVDAALSREMREILVLVVEKGTGQYLRIPGFDFGGKSGTSDIGKGYTKKDYLASFEAFAPAGDPEIVILVQMEKPRGKRTYGAWVAGPVVAQVLRRYFRVEGQPRLVREGLDES